MQKNYTGKLWSGDVSWKFYNSSATDMSAKCVELTLHFNTEPNVFTIVCPIEGSTVSDYVEKDNYLTFDTFTWPKNFGYDSSASSGVLSGLIFSATFS